MCFTVVALKDSSHAKIAFTSMLSLLRYSPVFSWQCELGKSRALVGARLIKGRQSIHPKQSPLNPDWIMINSVYGAIHLLDNRAECIAGEGGLFKTSYVFTGSIFIYQTLPKLSIRIIIIAMVSNCVTKMITNISSTNHWDWAVFFNSTQVIKSGYNASLSKRAGNCFVHLSGWSITYLQFSDGTPWTRQRNS